MIIDRKILAHPYQSVNHVFAIPCPQGEMSQIPPVANSPGEMGHQSANGEENTKTTVSLRSLNKIKSSTLWVEKGAVQNSPGLNTCRIRVLQHMTFLGTGGVNRPPSQ